MNLPLVDVSGEEYVRLLNNAKYIMQIAHTGQKYGNLDYDYHIYNVVAEVTELVQNLSPNWNKDNKYWTNDVFTLIILAMIHDSVEDDKSWIVNLDYVKSLGFSDDLVFALDCITKKENETYEKYMNRVKLSKYSHFVKLADSKSNLKESEGLGETNSTYNKGRVKKYSRNVNELSETLPLDFDFITKG